MMRHRAIFQLNFSGLLMSGEMSSVSLYQKYSVGLLFCGREAGEARQVVLWTEALGEGSETAGCKDSILLLLILMALLLLLLLLLLQ